MATTVSVLAAHIVGAHELPYRNFPLSRLVGSGIGKQLLTSR